MAWAAARPSPFRTPSKIAWWAARVAWWLWPRKVRPLVDIRNDSSSGAAMASRNSASMRLPLDEREGLVEADVQAVEARFGRSAIRAAFDVGDGVRHAIESAFDRRERRPC